MQLNINNLSNNEKKFLISLLDDGSKPNTKISKETEISKATCSRIRKKLNKYLISSYIPIIELDKVGINVFLVLTFQWKAFNNVALTKKVFNELERNPNVIFLANGEGSNISSIVFMGFKNLEGYHYYLKDFRRKYGAYVSNINSLLLPSKEVIKNDYTEVIKKVLGGN